MAARSRTMVGLLAAGAILSAGAAAAWWLVVEHSTFYTDADQIRESVDQARLRDILWRPPVRLDPVLAGDADEIEPRHSLDGDTLYLARRSESGDTDLLMSHRSNGGWSTPEVIPSLQTLDNEQSPQPSPDGAWLYFASDRPGGEGGFDLWRAPRIDDGWGEPEPLGPSVNSARNDAWPALSPDGTVLYFASDRDAVPDGAEAAPSTRTFDLFSAVHDPDVDSDGENDPEWTAADRLDDLSSDGDDLAPAVSPVGDFLYFASDRTGGRGGFDLYRARRMEGEHEAVESLGRAVNTAANELDPSPTMGGFGLLFSSDAASPPDLGSEDDPAPSAGARAASYDLFETTSREVFQGRETRFGDWRQLLMLLPWILAALAIALLFSLLRRVASDESWQVRWAALSLMAKCVLLSLLLHAALMAMLSYWEVTRGQADRLAQAGAAKVSITSSAVSSAAADQVRGALTDVAVDVTPGPEAPRAESDAPAAESAEATDIRPERSAQDAVQASVRIEAPVDSTRRAEAMRTTAALPTEAPALPELDRPQATARQADAAEQAMAVTAESPTLERPSADALDLPADQASPVRVDPGSSTVRDAVAAPAATDIASSPEARDAAPTVTAASDAPPTATDALALALPETASAPVDGDEPSEGAATIDAAVTPNAPAPRPTPRGGGAAAPTTVAVEPAVGGGREPGPQAELAVESSAAAPAAPAPSSTAASTPPVPTLHLDLSLPSGDGVPSDAAEGTEERAPDAGSAVLAGADAPTRPSMPTASASGRADLMPDPVGPSVAATDAPPRSADTAALDSDAAPEAPQFTPTDEPTTDLATVLELGTPGDVVLSGQVGDDVTETQVGLDWADPVTSKAPSTAPLPVDRPVDLAPDAIDRAHDDSPELGAQIDADAAAPETESASAAPTTLPSADVVALALPDPTRPVPELEERYRMSGFVLDAETRQPLEGAVVRLALDESSDRVDFANADGSFLLSARAVPNNVAVTATMPGYIPAATNVSKRALRRGARVTFLLEPENPYLVAIERDPVVHHLGNDQFTGRINSQFQRESEGRRLSIEFELAREQVPPFVVEAQLRILAKGVQLEDPVFINGRRLPSAMPESPDDGSFGEAVLEVPIGFLRAGVNELEIRSIKRPNTDFDDFEFVNPRLLLRPRDAL